MASSKIKVQFDGLKEFQKIIEEMEKEKEQLMIDTVKELAARLLRKVIKRTPSDTGNLRRNWTVSDVKKNGVPAIGKRLKKSWVKGKFMLTISESELQKQAPAVIEKKITEWLKKLGG